MSARIFNVLLGAWLFLSAFAWPHSGMQFPAALVCGGLTVVLSLATIYIPGLRYLTAVVAALLFASSIASVRHWDPRTSWHNAIIAVAIFVAALIDRGPAGARRELYGRT